MEHIPHQGEQKVAKSHFTDDPIIQYCTKVSVKQHPLEKELHEKTLKVTETPGLIGPPEVHQLGKNMIRLIKAKRVLDIGTFTGASALAWALALPPDGEVLSMDVTHKNLDSVGKPIIAKNPDILKKINFQLASAVETLDALIANGQTEKWDFAFIDADKENYPSYYEHCVQLIRPGGVILIDNALWFGKVIEKDKDAETNGIDKTNQLAKTDDRVENVLMNLGDGTHLIFKL